MENQSTKTSDPNNLRLGWVIKEEIGPCLIDPSILNKFPIEYSLSSFPVSYLSEFISYEDFEPYEVCIEEFEDFITYHTWDD